MEKGWKEVVKPASRYRKQARKPRKERKYK